LQRSLASPFAKVWFPPDVDEAGARPEAGTVSCAVWKNARAHRDDVVKAISKRGTIADDQFIVESMQKGECVPVAGALAVIGAFVGDRVYIPLKKRTRAEQIHLMGWS